MSTPRVPRDDDHGLVVDETTLAEFETQWRAEDHPYHDLEAIEARVRQVLSDAEPEGDLPDIEQHATVAYCLGIIERHWRQHPAYTTLRDTVLTRLGQMQGDDERTVWDARDATRRRLAAQEWADRQILSIQGL